MSARRHHLASCPDCPAPADTARMPALSATIRRRPPLTNLAVRELHGAELRRALVAELLAELAEGGEL